LPGAFAASIAEISGPATCVALDFSGSRLIQEFFHPPFRQESEKMTTIWANNDAGI